MCMAFRHHHSRWGRLIEAAEVEGEKEQGEDEGQEKPTLEVQWSRTGGCLLLMRRTAPWKKNGCEIAPCSAICRTKTPQASPRALAQATGRKVALGEKMAPPAAGR
jgi:hypothetical protein